MDSGSILTTESAGSSEAQAIYDQVVAAANCSEHLDTLGCLREISYSQFRAAVDTFPNFFSYKGLDLAYLPRFDPNDDGFFSTSPEFSIQCGQFAKVPIIIGDQEDEGTLFSQVQYNLTSTETSLITLRPYSRALNVRFWWIWRQNIIPTIPPQVHPFAPDPQMRFIPSISIYQLSSETYFFSGRTGYSCLLLLQSRFRLGVISLPIYTEHRFWGRFTTLIFWVYLGRGEV